MNYKLIIFDACVVIQAIDSQAEAHDEARELIKHLVSGEGYDLVIPMHGFFEVKCAMKRMITIEGKKISSPFNSQLKALRFRPQPIDQAFLDNYFVHYAQPS